MSKQAFLFPGQGSQYVGMGAQILERMPGAFHLLDEASQVLRFDVGRLLREGPPDLLFQDIPAQLATYVTNAIYWAFWKEQGVQPWAVTGYSLGFYSALMAAEVFDFSTGLRMVKEAGRLMEEAALSRPGRMVAVIGLREEEVVQICREVADQGSVEIANLNASRQLIISGDERALEAASRRAMACGALEVRDIGVGAPYHSRLMEGPSMQFADYLSPLPVADPRLPVLSYLDAEYVRDGGHARELLSRQLRSQIRWKDCIDRLVGEGVDTFIEVGPGQMLSRLTRWIARNARAIAVDGPGFLERDLPAGEGLRRDGP